MLKLFKSLFKHQSMNRDAFVGVAVLTAILISITFILVSDPTGKVSAKPSDNSSLSNLTLLEKSHSSTKKYDRSSSFDMDFNVDYVMDTERNSSQKDQIAEEHKKPTEELPNPNQILNEPTMVSNLSELDSEDNLVSKEVFSALEKSSDQKIASNLNLSDQKPVTETNKPKEEPLNPLSFGDLDYKVKSGDTLSSIAAEHYGESSKYKFILKANKNLNPSRLKVGDSITLPAFNKLADLEKPETIPEKIEMKKVKLDEVKWIEDIKYTVKSGDTGSGIAKKFYGNANKWKLIQAANSKADLGKLKVGQILVLPSPK